MLIEKAIDIAGVIAWCFLVYVCVFDWEDVREREKWRRNNKG